MGFEQNIRRVEPYVAGEQPEDKDIVKLNTNECPYPPSPALIRRAEQLSMQQLRLYPDMNAGKLVDALAAYYQVRPSQVFAGVGSDDVLSLSFMTFFHSDRPVLFPDVTYSFYDVWAQLHGIPYELCPLDENFCIRREDYLRPNGGIIFPNPNAPTGILESVDTIEEIVRKNQDSVVIIDEAYIDFGGESALPLIERYDNLLIVQTFSKSRSMAGMRVGYAMGQEELIQALGNVKYSYNSYTMNMPSIILGAEAVRDEAYFRETTGKIMKTRENAKARLSRLGFSCTDSRTNFLFITHPRVKAAQLFEALRRGRIYVRYFRAPRLDNYLRVTVGTDEEMEVLYDFLESYLERL